MIRLYCRRHGKVVTTTPEEGSGLGLPAGIVWIDVLEPSGKDSAWIKAMIGVEIPSPEEMREIEPSSRLYREGLAVFMTASVLNNTETNDPETRAITFILVNDVLLTVRYSSPVPFQTFLARIQAQPEFLESAEMALAELLDAIIDRVADTLEMIDSALNRLSQTIFRPATQDHAAPPNYSEALQIIGISSLRCTKVDESLIGLARLLAYFDSNLRLRGHDHVRARVKEVRQDLVSLISYVEHLSHRIELTLNATLGMINIQQNQIIKIFSVLAVIFLPPTLVASVYGMNFDFMPELHWRFGYAWALGLMLFAAIVPYWLFRRRGWL